jgi:superoxide reductase
MNMAFQPKFYRCSNCGQIISVLKDEGIRPHCCGQPMEKLSPNTVDAAKEKHIPVVTRDGDILTVKIGSVEHPMLEEHYIEWIYVFQDNGGQRRVLSPGSPPEAQFHLSGGEPIEVYAYCNLHGLWKTVV